MPPPDQIWDLKLFIGGSSIGRSAVANLKALCEEVIPGRYRLEVVDVTTNPHAAEEERILALPTLIRKSPLPSRKIIGDMRNRDMVTTALDLPVAK